jgi:hypothetical protein
MGWKSFFLDAVIFPLQVFLDLLPWQDYLKFPDIEKGMTNQKWQA